MTTPIASGVSHSDLMTADQAAVWLGVNRQTVLRYARNGSLPCVRFTQRTVRFHRETILDRASRSSVGAMKNTKRKAGR